MLTSVSLLWFTFRIFLYYSTFLMPQSHYHACQSDATMIIGTIWNAANSIFGMSPVWPMYTTHFYGDQHVCSSDSTMDGKIWPCMFRYMHRSHLAWAPCNRDHATFKLTFQSHSGTLHPANHWHTIIMKWLSIDQWLITDLTTFI